MGLTNVATSKSNWLVLVCN